VCLLVTTVSSVNTDILIEVHTFGIWTRVSPVMCHIWGPLIPHEKGHFGVILGHDDAGDTLRPVPVDGRADQCVRPQARGFLLVFYENHSLKMHCFEREA